MSMAKAWRYQIAHCRFKETKAPGWLGKGREGHWVLALDQEYALAEGLNHMGSLGYELVGIQLAVMETVGGEGGTSEPESIYVFKQPLDT